MTTASAALLALSIGLTTGFVLALYLAHRREQRRDAAWAAESAADERAKVRADLFRVQAELQAARIERDDYSWSPNPEHDRLLVEFFTAALDERDAR